MPLALFFFLRTALDIQGLLCFHAILGLFYYFVKNAIGILVGIALHPCMALGSIDIFTILILPIHEQRIFFHLFVSYSISLIKVLQFSLYRSFISLVKFIPKYITGFDAIVNGIVFFISFSDIMLLVYRNTTDFYILKLY